MIIIDTRNKQLQPVNKNKFLFSKPTSFNEDSIWPIFLLLMQKCMGVVRHYFNQLLYRLSRLNYPKGVKKILEKKLPWFKIGILTLTAFILLNKDMQFNFSMKSPIAAFLEEESQEDRATAQQMAIKNPHAPVSATSLQEKQARAFISEYAQTAKSEMEIFGIPASIKMAQALIESRAGSSYLAKNNKNFFGMKCFSKKCRKGHCSNATDDHHKDFFRKFENTWESWRAHSKLLSQGRYKHLKSHKNDYKKWAHGLKEAGYATDKKYAAKLINVIEKYQLYKLDSM